MDLYTNQIRDAENTTARIEAKFSRWLPWKSNVAPGGSGFTMDLYTNQIRDAENALVAL